MLSATQESTRVCCKCRCDYVPSSYQIRKRYFICLACRKAYKAAQKEKVRLGIPTKREPYWTAEYKAAWKKEYSKRPDQLAKAAEREAMKRRDPKNAEKLAARTAVSVAVRTGNLIPQPCESCSKTPTQAHHDDYSKPLDVRWLCQRCHTEHHRREKQRSLSPGVRVEARP